MAFSHTNHTNHNYHPYDYHAYVGSNHFDSTGKFNHSKNSPSYARPYDMPTNTRRCTGTMSQRVNFPYENNEISSQSETPWSSPVRGNSPATLMVEFDNKMFGSGGLFGPNREQSPIIQIESPTHEYTVNNLSIQDSNRIYQERSDYDAPRSSISSLDNMRIAGQLLYRDSTPDSSMLLHQPLPRDPSEIDLSTSPYAEHGNVERSPSNLREQSFHTNEALIYSDYGRPQYHSQAPYDNHNHYLYVHHGANERMGPTTPMSKIPLEYALRLNPDLRAETEHGGPKSRINHPNWY